MSSEHDIERPTTREERPVSPRRSTSSKRGRVVQRAAGLTGSFPQQKPPRTASGWARRAHSRRTKTTLAIVVVVVVIAVASGLAVQTYLSTTPQALIDEAVEYVARADVNIVQMDDVLNSQVTTATMSEIANIRPGVEGAVDALETAQKLLERAQGKDQGMASEIRVLEQAIDARLDMLALAPPLVNLTDNAGESLIAALDGYDYLTSAASQAEAAKAAFNPASPEAVANSSQLADEAIDTYRSAEQAFVLAAESLSAADYSAYTKFIGLRVQMLQAMKAAGAHMASNQPASANDQIRLFNDLSAQAAAIASSSLLPVESIVEAGYESAAGTISADYSAARSKVLELDMLVR